METSTAVSLPPSLDDVLSAAQSARIGRVDFTHRLVPEPQSEPEPEPVPITGPALDVDVAEGAARRCELTIAQAEIGAELVRLQARLAAVADAVARLGDLDPGGPPAPGDGR